jgi:hypothetical protein
MLILFFILIIIDFVNKYSPNENKYLESTFRINREFTKLMGIIGAASSFSSYIINKNRKDIEKITNDIFNQKEEALKSLRELENSQDNTNAEVTSNLGLLAEKLESANNSFIKLKNILKNKEEVITEKDMNTNSDLKYLLSEIQTDWNKVVDYNEAIKKAIDKNKFLPDNFDYKNIYENITNDQLGGIGLILFSQVILVSAISIIFVFFGEYLIQRYEIEKKYPKLAKFIQLRRKFQKYYLILNILYILLIALILFIFGIWLFFI